MSYYDYEASKQLELLDAPFYAIIMAAMRRADSINVSKLKAAFPGTWYELQERYNTPGGKLEGEQE